MLKNMLILACCFAIAAVIIGAFGAHGLEGKLAAKQMASFETGVRYQFYHTFGIFFAVILAQNDDKGLNLWSARCFAIGIFLFSGSIYLLSCRFLLGIEHWKWLGPLTPIGGTFFITGWILLLIAVLKKDKYVGVEP